MDIFAHGLWAGAAAKAVNVKTGQKKMNFTLTMFWGVFPDLFAFTIPFVWMIYQLALGGMSFAEFSTPHEPAQMDGFPLFALAHSLYNISHSIPVFLLLFGAVYLFLKRPPWEMFGILIHILSDIPTHSYEFFPTPFLWPLSDFKVDGFAWGTPWFLALNYSLLVAVYTMFYIKRRRIALP